MRVTFRRALRSGSSEDFWLLMAFAYYMIVGGMMLIIDRAWFKLTGKVIFEKVHAHSEEDLQREQEKKERQRKLEAFKNEHPDDYEWIRRMVDD